MEKTLAMVSTDPVWAIEPLAAERLAAGLSTLPAEAWRTPAVARPALPMTVAKGVATIDVHGPLTRYPSVFSILAGGTATDDIRRAVEAAAKDDAVRAILLSIDSPGGSANGIAEAADAIFEARKKKPVVAAVSGMVCSAAYHLASQSTRIVAERMALVGSIGAKMILLDISKQFEKDGVRAVVIDSGAFKSAGEPGTIITGEHEKYFGEIVEAFASDFRRAIVRGRKMSAGAVDAVSTGKVYVADEALRLGLIDEIGSLESISARLKTDAGSITLHQRSEEMSSNNAAATLAELEAACPAMGAEFLMTQLRAGATIGEAQKAALAEKDRELQALRSPAKRSGVKAMSDRGTGNAATVIGDAVSEFDEAVAEKMKGGMERRQAVIAVAKQNPELHHGYVSATNPATRRVQDLIEERFSL